VRASFFLRPSVLVSVAAHGVAAVVGWSFGVGGSSETSPVLDVAFFEATGDAPDPDPLPAPVPVEPELPAPSAVVTEDAVPSEEPTPEGSSDLSLEPPESTSHLASPLAPSPSARVSRAPPRASATTSRPASPVPTVVLASASSRGHVVSASPLATNAPPDYPPVARSRGWEGTAWIRATVEVDGSVSQAALERSSGFAVLDRAALDAVGSWRYVPRTVDGVAVRGAIVQPVEFHLR